jgi:hypothetical protein
VDVRLEFFYDSTVEPFRVDDIDVHRALGLLEELGRRGVEVIVHDTAGWDYGMQMEHYMRAVGVSVRRRYGLRRVFGSARTSGWLFGRQVPALLVLEDGQVTDVYPHVLAGRRRTILEFLLGKLREMGE